MTAPPTVLCVDDDSEILAVVTRILNRDGYQMLAVTSPNEALAILSSRPVAVMVSDFEMPEMTGVELAVRARRVQPETARIMLTGRKSLDTALAGINVGEVFRFLNKPFEPDVLRRDVAAAVIHHRESTIVQKERSTVVRREHMLAALENDHPGIVVVARDDSGAYLLDGEARHWVPPTLASIAALLTGRR